MFFEWLEGLRMELSGEHLLPHGTTQSKAEQTVSPDSWLMNKHSWVSHLSSVFKQSLKLCRTARVKIKTALQLRTCLPFHSTKRHPLNACDSHDPEASCRICKWNQGDSLVSPPLYWLDISDMKSQAFTSVLGLSLLNESLGTIAVVLQGDTLWCHSDPSSSKTTDMFYNISVPTLPFSKMYWIIISIHCFGEQISWDIIHILYNSYV